MSPEEAAYNNKRLLVQFYVTEMCTEALSKLDHTFEHHK
jgi:hypothetical protein